MYLIYDYETKAVVDKSNSLEVAEAKCKWLDELHAYVDGHTYGYKIYTGGL